MVTPQEPNRRWCHECVSDALACGRRFRLLNVIDDYRRMPRTYRHILLSGRRVGRTLATMAKPTSQAVFAWCQGRPARVAYIAPDGPHQNGVVESFKGCLREDA